jgi:hypothetical protein
MGVNRIGMEKTRSHAPRFSTTIQVAFFSMATITFDTHKFVRKLTEAGFEEKQAEALTEALRAAIEDSELVTRKDLQIELAPIKSDLTVVKWMLGLVLGGVAALVLKSFF